MRILYIAGYGRSGSTLLDVLLAGHDEVFGAGELKSVFRERAADRPCACGQALSRCPLWGDVFAATERRLGTLDLDRLQRLTWRQQGLRGGDARGFAEYERVWRAVIDAIGERAAAQVLVDSSKSVRRSYRRPALLARSGYDVRMLHLVRDPRAVMWSIHRGGNRELEQDRPARLRGGMIRGLVNWLLANAWVERTRPRTAERYRLLRYEDLVRDPAGELARLAPFVGLDLAPILAAVRLDRALDPGHGIDGNRMRRHGPVRIRADDEWRRQLPALGRAAALLAWPLCRRYGYPARAETGS